ncbi:MAG: glycosyltransferase family 2 protein [Sphingobacteriales bacterium]|nr:MAG: glycosyltransferase family 2 protein [Sphingobacteriales bacterium]
MTIGSFIWVAVQFIIGFHLVFPVLLLCIFGIVKVFSRYKPAVAVNEADYAIIVTAYEQTDLLPSVVDSILKLNYSNYLIYIVADKCDISNLKFDTNKVILLRPEKTIASNVGSHFYAIERFVRQHERLTIIDSDNLVDPEYLNELNRYFDRGYNAVQGVREAKNLNTTYACLDAARDKYYHYYDGKLLYGIGSSATLAGSGMAFTTQLYKACLEGSPVKGAGFDKVLQYKILEKGERIAFAEKAIVYDEKTSKPDQLVKQRARWINTWFKYFSLGFKLTMRGLVKANWNQVAFGVVLLRPPLFIFLLLSVGFLFINVLVAPAAAMIWVFGFTVFLTGFFISLLVSETDQAIYRSLRGIPKFMFLQVVSLVKARKANQYSVATRHSVIQDNQ